MVLRSIVAAALAALAPAAAFAGDQAAAPAVLSRAPAPESLEEQRLAAFVSLLDQAALKDDFVGLAVAVVVNGEVKLIRTYGVKSVDVAEPVTPYTAFRIASLSKGFAASLAGLAISEGKISLTTPVAPYAPGFALSGATQGLVTVDHILSHRVGLPPNAYDNLLEAGVAVSEILPRYKSVKPICKVGECYAYQNIAFSLIGDVLASTYSEPYAKLVNERLFQPLGMRTASVGAANLSASGDWARPHSRKRIKTPKGAPPEFTPWTVGKIDDAYYRTPAAGGVNASVTDMTRWLLAQMGGAPEVLPESVLNEIHSPVVASPAETRRQGPLRARILRTQYGRGWRIYDYAGHTVINHSGGVEGYGAQIAWLPENNTGIVVLANSRAKRVFRIVPTFLDIALGLDHQDWLELEEPLIAGEDATAIAGGGH